MRYVVAVLLTMAAVDAAAQSRRGPEPEDYDQYERPRGRCVTKQVVSPVPIGSFCQKMSPLVYICYVVRCDR